MAFRTVVSCVEELTVVSGLLASCNEPRRAHRDAPFGERPPPDDTYRVFAQGPTESPFSFDARLQQCLEDPALLRSLARVVLVCGSEITDRQILRRVRLAAALLKPGGNVTLSYNPTHDPSHALSERLARLAHFASTAMAGQCVIITVLPVSKIPEETAPLSAAWRRLQRQRNGRNGPTSRPPPAQEPTARPAITQTVVHQRVTHLVHTDTAPTGPPPLILAR